VPSASTLAVFALASFLLIVVPGPWLGRFSGAVFVGLGVTAALTGRPSE